MVWVGEEGNKRTSSILPAFYTFLVGQNLSINYMKGLRRLYFLVETISVAFVACSCRVEKDFHSDSEPSSSVIFEAGTVDRRRISKFDPNKHIDLFRMGPTGEGVTVEAHSGIKFSSGSLDRLAHVQTFFPDLIRCFGRSH